MTEAPSIRFDISECDEIITRAEDEDLPSSGEEWPLTCESEQSLRDKVENRLDGMSGTTTRY